MVFQAWQHVRVGRNWLEAPQLQKRNDRLASVVSQSLAQAFGCYIGWVSCERSGLRYLNQR